MIPAKEADAQYTYEFSGWRSVDGSPLVLGETVTGEILAVAAYNSVQRSYTILFYQDDGATLVHSYTGPYGSLVELPADPEHAPTTSVVYSFNGWSGYTEGLTVSGRMMFFAVYDREIVFEEETDGAYNVDLPDTSGVSFTDDNISELKIAAATDDTVTLTVSTVEGTVVFDRDAILSFEGGNYFEIQKLDDTTMTAETAAIVGDAPTYEIYFGTNRDFGTGTATVTIPYQLKDGEDPNHLIVYYISDGRVAEGIECTYSNGCVTFTTNHFSTYAIMYIEPESEEQRPAMYTLIGGIMLLVLVGAASLVSRRN